jgi:probable HAF family extracellular repeat protein
MKKAVKLFVAAIGVALCTMTSAEGADSITYTVGGLQVTLTDLGVLPGGTFSTALAINRRGEIAGYANAPGATTWEWLLVTWDANTGAVLATQPYTGAIPEKRNDNGEMAGTNCIGGCGRLYQGVYWNAAGQAFILPAFPGTDPLYGSTHTMAHGINNLGQIVGEAKDGTASRATHAVLWPDKDTQPLDVGFLGKGAYVDYSTAQGVNELTHVVGIGAVGTADRGFLWRNGGMIDLGALSGQAVSEAYAVNNTGLIAGKSNLYPVTWQYDVANPSSVPRIQQLPIPSGFFSATPTAVNDAGDVAGYGGSPSIDAHAILWRGGKAVDLGVWPGGTYSVAHGINDVGQIVGTGTVAGDNLDHALVWTVVAVGGGGGGTTNTTPLASLQATSSTSIRVGRSVSVQAGFTDPDNGPWSYRLDWGDGRTTSGTTSSPGTISGISPHVYTRSGSYRATLTVTDGKGAAGGSKTISVRVR